MKRSVSQIVVIAISLALFFNSCKKTEDAAPSGSTTGPTAFAGHWNNSENSKLNGQATYPVTIAVGNSSTILISNLYGFLAKITANVANNNFSIPLQVVDGVNVSGAGVLANPNQINMMYVVENGVTNDTVNAVLLK